MIDAVIVTALGLGAIVLGLLFMMALLSPLEALTWWAGWSNQAPNPGTLSQEALAEIGVKIDVEEDEQMPAYFLVYLTAIGGVSADAISYREQVFLERLQEALPDAVLVSDVYPFSVSNNPLTGERMFAWLWRKIHERRKTVTGAILASFIFARNLFNVAVSADPRYGPINNAGVAREIIKSLYRHGYPLAGDIPVVTIGWSGGGQIAVGVTPFLHLGLDAPVYVVSIGGVLTDDPSIAFVEHLWHLQGSKDRFPKIGDILFPGRWPFVKKSAWNRFKRAGKMTTVITGPMVHTGKGDYFDPEARLPDGTVHVDRTVQIIQKAVQSIQPPPPTSIEEELERYRAI